MWFFRSKISSNSLKNCSSTSYFIRSYQFLLFVFDFIKDFFVKSALMPTLSYYFCDWSTFYSSILSWTSLELNIIIIKFVCECLSTSYYKARRLVRNLSYNYRAHQNSHSACLFIQARRYDVIGEFKWRHNFLASKFLVIILFLVRNRSDPCKVCKFMNWRKKALLKSVNL